MIVDNENTLSNIQEVENKRKSKNQVEFDENLKQSFINNKLDLNRRTLLNKQMDLNQFFKQSRHFFIMTDGGKPIFSRYGDEVENCGILATFSAIITKFTFFNNTSTTTEKLQYNCLNNLIN